jgi:O-antigen ligase
MIAAFIAPALTAALASGLWTDWRSQAARLARSPFALLVGVLLVGWCPSIVVSLSPRWSLAVWASTLPILLAAVAAGVTLARHEALRATVRRALIAATAVSLALALASLFAASEMLSLIRFQGWVPRDPAVGLKGYASAVMLLVPVVAWAGLRCGGGWRLLALVTVAAALAVIFATSARAAVAGLAAMAAACAGCWVVRAGGRSGVILGALTVAAAVVAAAWLAGQWARPAPATSFEPYLPVWLVDVHRQVIWAFAFDRFLDAPWFGWGINVIAQAEGAKIMVPGLGQETLPSHPHNWILEVAAETGVVGALPLYVLVAVTLRRLAGDAVRSGRGDSMAALAVAVGYWVSGLFNFSFWAAWWQMSHLLLLAVLLAERAAAPTPEPEP